MNTVVLTHEDFMRETLAVARASFHEGGGPFGALIVREGTIIARGRSLAEVLKDPTAHAEVMAIRAAGNALQRINLSDCIAYSSSEPCPMCLSAFYWAQIPVVYFGTSIDDTAIYGFEDKFIYRELAAPAPSRTLKFVSVLREEALSVLKDAAQTMDRASFIPDE